MRRDGADISDHEIASICYSQLFAGQETTTSLIGNGLRELLLHPQEWEAVTTDPTLVANAIDEILRFTPSIVAWRRRAKAATSIGGIESAGEDQICCSSWALAIVMKRCSTIPIASTCGGRMRARIYRWATAFTIASARSLPSCRCRPCSTSLPTPFARPAAHAGASIHFHAECVIPYAASAAGRMGSRCGPLTRRRAQQVFGSNFHLVKLRQRGRRKCGAVCKISDQTAHKPDVIQNVGQGTTQQQGMALFGYRKRRDMSFPSIKLPKTIMRLIGGKCAGLAALIAAGAAVPPGFAVTTHAYADMLAAHDLARRNSRRGPMR